jgi:hypothetical protein
VYCLEYAHRKNYEEAEQNLFYPKKPWKSIAEYKAEEEEYVNQWKKAQMT